MTFAFLNASWTMTGGIFVLNVVQPTKIWLDFLSAFWVIQAQPVLESHEVHKKTGQLPGLTLILSGHNSVNYKKIHKPGWPSCITPGSPHPHVCPSTPPGRRMTKDRREML